MKSQDVPHLYKYSGVSFTSYGQDYKGDIVSHLSLMDWAELNQGEFKELIFEQVSLLPFGSKERTDLERLTSLEDMAEMHIGMFEEY